MSSCCTNGLKTNLFAKTPTSSRQEDPTVYAPVQKQVTERTSRKREAGGPVSGCPSKVTVSRGLLHLHRPK
nr:PREDICTED: uncharacterized protein LOC103312476 isoform X3 [Tribolium castaneum]|eukprot:XP_015840234.1 PREDICTED: uncharacterized protein LOC103312476 isoform X3 [Tribolium castaneum]